MKKYKKNSESLQREKHFREKVRDYEMQLIKLNELLQNKEIENESLHKKLEQLRGECKLNIENLTNAYTEKQMANEIRIQVTLISNYKPKINVKKSIK